MKKAIYILGSNPELDAAINSLDDMDQEVEEFEKKAKAFHKECWRKIEEAARKLGVVPESKDPSLGFNHETGVLYYKGDIADKTTSIDGSEVIDALKKIFK